MAEENITEFRIEAEGLGLPDQVVAAFARWRGEVDAVSKAISTFNERGALQLTKIEGIGRAIKGSIFTIQQAAEGYVTSVRRTVDLLESAHQRALNLEKDFTRQLKQELHERVVAEMKAAKAARTFKRERHPAGEVDPRTGRAVGGRLLSDEEMIRRATERRGTDEYIRSLAEVLKLRVTSTLQAEAPFKIKAKTPSPTRVDIVRLQAEIERLQGSKHLQDEIEKMQQRAVARARNVLLGRKMQLDARQRLLDLERRNAVIDAGIATEVVAQSRNAGRRVRLLREQRPQFLREGGISRGEAYGWNRRRFGSLVGDLQQTGTQLASEGGLLQISAALSGLGLPLTVAGGLLASAEAFRRLTQDAMQWELTVARIRGLSQGAQLSADQWTASLHGLARAFGLSRIEVAAGMQVVLRSGVAQGKAALSIAEAAGRLAVATGTELPEGIESLTSLMAAYSMRADQAGEATGLLYNMFSRGQTPLDEVGRSFGNLSGVASALGVPLRETTAAFNVLRRQGVPTWMAVALISGILQKIIDRSPELEAAFKKMGYLSGQQALQAEGLHNILIKLSASVHGSAEAYAKLLPGMWSTQGAFMLLAGSGQQMREEFEAQQNSIKKLDAAFAGISETTAQKTARSYQMLETAAKSAYISIYEHYGERLSKVLDLFLSKMDATKRVPMLIDNRAIFAKMAADMLAEGEKQRDVDKARRELILEDAKSNISAEVDFFKQSLNEKSKLEREALQERHRLNVDVIQEEFKLRREQILEMREEREFKSKIETIRAGAAEVRLRGQYEADRLLGRKPSLMEALDRTFKYPLTQDLMQKEVGEDVFARRRFAMADVNLARYLGGGDFANAQQAVQEMGRITEEEIKRRIERAQQMRKGSWEQRKEVKLIQELFEQQARLKEQEADIASALRRRELDERRADRRAEHQEKLKLNAVEHEQRLILQAKEHEERLKLDEAAIRIKQAKDEVSLLLRLKAEDYLTRGMLPAYQAAFDLQAEGITRGLGGLDEKQVERVERVILRYRALMMLEAERYFLQQKYTEAMAQRAGVLAQVDKAVAERDLVRTGILAAQLGSSERAAQEAVAALNLLDAEQQEVGERKLRREIARSDARLLQSQQFQIQGIKGFKEEQTRNAPSEVLMKMNEAISSFTSAIELLVLPGTGSFTYLRMALDGLTKYINDKFSGVPQKQTGGYISTAGLNYLHAGEYVVNPRGTAQFYPQLVALNSGRQLNQRTTSTNTYGDVSVIINESHTPQATAREVAQAIRRERRRGTVGGF